MRRFYFECFDETGAHRDDAGMPLDDTAEAVDQASGLLAHMLGRHTDALGCKEATLLVRSNQGGARLRRAW